METDQKVMVFDGVCELCNRSVDFILKWEKRPELKFTANQNEPGREILRAHGYDPDDVSTIFLLDNGKLYTRSSAALRLAKLLRFPFNLLYGFMVVPRFLRDPVYKYIARNRYRFWGKKDTCRIPTPEEIARFMM